MLLDDLYAERAIILNLRKKRVTVSDPQLSTDVDGNVRLVPRDLTLGITALIIHTRKYGNIGNKHSVISHHFPRCEPLFCVQQSRLYPKIRLC